MNTSPRNNNGSLVRQVWYRRLHRVLGIAALVFLLLLSATGIALNHVSDWRLDKRHIGWPWLLDAYGIEVPLASASFAHNGHRATLLGGRLYFDGEELSRDIDALVGVGAVEGFVVVATADVIFLLTAGGELIERLQADSASPIEAVGTDGSRVILRSGDRLFHFDDGMVRPEPWSATNPDDLRWSASSPLPARDREKLAGLWRGQGVTLARLLADLHSGRILTRAGPLLMDAAGVVLVLLCLTGLFMWLPKGTRGSNGKTPR